MAGLSVLKAYIEQPLRGPSEPHTLDIDSCPADASSVPIEGVRTMGHSHLVPHPLTHSIDRA